MDGIAVPMPHFGAILDWDGFQALAARPHRRLAAGSSFRRGCASKASPAERATLFLLDPSGNALEFKAFRHADHVFTA